MKTDHDRHHNQITEKDIETYKPNKQILYYLDYIEKKTGKARKDIKVLDFGCGRAVLCILLTRMGYHAHGVDIDKAGVVAGQDFMATCGYDKEVLGLIDETGKTKFEDGYFDLIISDQVIEHVENIALTSAECARLTKQQGWGIHSYPACYLPVEPHIFVPFVHWLPKNKLRQYWIHLCLYFKKKTKWDHLKHMTKKQLAEYYYEYLNQQTFYRLPSKVISEFEKKGFNSELVVVNHPKIQKIKVVNSLLKIPPLAGLINLTLGIFLQTDLLMEKRS